MVYLSIDFIMPSSKLRTQLRLQRLQCHWLLAPTLTTLLRQQAHGHRQWKQLVEKGAIDPGGLRTTIRAMSWKSVEV